MLQTKFHTHVNDRIVDLHNLFLRTQTAIYTYTYIQGGSNMTGTDHILFTQTVPVIFEPPCTYVRTRHIHKPFLTVRHTFYHSIGLHEL